ncbi:hypothetical protein D3C72_1754240 [compost metagenome]
MIAGFQHGAKNIIVSDLMTAPGTVTYIDPCAGYIVNCIVQNTQRLCHRHLYTCHLFFDQTDAVDQIVTGFTIHGVIITFRTFEGVHLIEWNKFFIAKRR